MVLKDIHSSICSYLPIEKNYIILNCRHSVRWKFFSITMIMPLLKNKWDSNNISWFQLSRTILYCKLLIQNNLQWFLVFWWMPLNLWWDCILIKPTTKWKYHVKFLSAHALLTIIASNQTQCRLEYKQCPLVITRLTVAHWCFPTSVGIVKPHTNRLLGAQSKDPILTKIA